MLSTCSNFTQPHASVCRFIKNKVNTLHFLSDCFASHKINRQNFCRRIDSLILLEETAW